MRLWFGKKGLGPNFLGPIRYLLPYNSLFHKAACVHDHLYGISGSQEKADKIFLRMCFAVCKTEIQAAFSYLYYDLVRKYGYLFKKN